MISDTQLVARYSASQSADDFAQIVARHGPMVLRTCQRLTHNAQDAEDAAQATFLVLAQKTGAVTENLAGWLHKVARDAAFRIVRERSRRGRREEAAARMRTSGCTPYHGDELREELDAALIQLPERLREAVVLRFLEGRNYPEAALLAGCTEPTMRWRSMKGLQRLRQVLARRQAVFTLGTLAALLLQESTASAATTASLTAWAATGTTATANSGQAALVAKGLVNAMYWAKVKMYAAVTAVVATVAGASVPLVLPERPAPVVAQPAVNLVQLGVNASLGGRRPFPADNLWNKDISREPVDPNSDQLIASIGAETNLFPNFGPGTYRGGPQGVPYIVIGGGESRQPVRFTYAEDSDAGPYPIPASLPLKPEHLGQPGVPLIIIDRDDWKLYELNAAAPSSGSWRGECGAIFDLGANQPRPGGRLSADVAGMPVFPGLVRHDEVVEQKRIQHALRFTARRIRAAHVAPAQHTFGKQTDANLPPLGLRMRLKADYNISRFSPDMQVVLTALKKYGMFLAEYGTDWYISGTNDPRWDDRDLKTLKRIQGKDFEVVRLGELHFGR